MTYRKYQDYIYVKDGHQSTFEKIKHYLRRENKVNKKKVSLCWETIRYM